MTLVQPVLPTLFRHSTIPSLHLSNSSIDLPSLRYVIRRWLDGFNISEWRISNGPTNEALCSLFPGHKLFHFDFSGPLPSHRPLVFVKTFRCRDEVSTWFCLVRDDDECVFVGLYADCIHNPDLHDVHQLSISIYSGRRPDRPFPYMLF